MSLKTRLNLIEVRARLVALRARKVASGVYYRVPAAVRPKPKLLAGHVTTAAAFGLAKFGVHLSPAEAGYLSVAAGVAVGWFVRDEKLPESADHAESPTAPAPADVADEGPIKPS